MGQEDITAILLPASRVDLFALDEGTAALAGRLAQDWRFARVAVSVEKSGIEGAIARYGQTPSAELVIIETNDISEAFIQQLGNLAGVCAEGTDAVVIGPKNDVQLYRSLVEMGIKDYLVRPVAPEDMVKVIARTLVEKRGMLGSRLVAVIGSKGGVGATTVAQVLAWDIAEILKQKTMLMDAAGSAGSIGIAYGLEPSTSLTEAVRLGASGSEDDMRRIYQKVSEQFSLLVCGGEPLLADSPDADSIETLVNRVMQKFPVVVVDLSRALPAVQKRLIARASEIIVVTTPMLSALRNARTLLAEIKTLKSHLKEVDLVLNMQGAASSEKVPVKDISAALGMDPAAVIAFAPKIFIASETTGKPVGENKTAAAVLEGLLPVAMKATAVEDRKVKADDKGGGLMGRIKKVIGK